MGKLKLSERQVETAKLIALYGQALEMEHSVKLVVANRAFGETEDGEATALLHATEGLVVLLAESLENRGATLERSYDPKPSPMRAITKG